MVISGDLTISVADVDLIFLGLRVLLTSVDKAREMGIDWWQGDPALSSRARKIEDENRLLRERLDRLEARAASPA